MPGIPLSKAFSFFSRGLALVYTAGVQLIKSRNFFFLSKYTIISVRTMKEN